MAHQFSRRLVKPFVLVWLLCQSMLLCAAGISESSMAFAGISKNQATVFTASSDEKAPDLMINHHAAAHFMNASDTGAEVELTAAMNHHDVSGHSAQPGENCCGEDSQSATIALASLAPVAVLFAVFWLISLITRRISVSRWWQAPTAGCHYPRFHVINCSYLH